MGHPTRRKRGRFGMAGLALLTPAHQAATCVTDPRGSIPDAGFGRPPVLRTRLGSAWRGLRNCGKDSIGLTKTVSNLLPVARRDPSRRVRFCDYVNPLTWPPSCLLRRAPTFFRPTASHAPVFPRPRCRPSQLLSMAWDHAQNRLREGVPRSA